MDDSRTFPYFLLFIMSFLVTPVLECYFLVDFIDLAQTTALSLSLFLAGLITAYLSFFAHRYYSTGAL
jgi:hypothetical protein